MNSDELVEKVATEIGFQIGHEVEIDVRANQMTGDELNILARAALRIVLEEAAKVADDNYRWGRNAFYIANAIRAMIPGEK